MSLFHAGLQPALDSDGAPIAGATWTFFLTGSATPTNVFADAAYITSLGDTLTADANGRFTTAFVDDSAPAKAVLKDAGGATLQTIDPVTTSAGGGSVVSSVDVSGGTTGLTTTGGPVTGSGTITLAGTLAVANGGTGSGTAAGARGNLGSAASGANTDITALDQDVAITATGTIAADSIGFRGLPINSKTAAYELVLADAGKHVSITTGGVTIPANASVAFPVGTVVALFNNSGSTQALVITTDTLRLGGTTSTGARTLAAYGLVSLLKVTSTVWIVTGNVT